MLLAVDDLQVSGAGDGKIDTSVVVDGVVVVVGVDEDGVEIPGLGVVPPVPGVLIPISKSHPSKKVHVYSASMHVFITISKYELSGQDPEETTVVPSQ